MLNESRLERILLAVFVVSLPTSEAVKNVSLFLFFGTWLIRRVRNGDWGNSAPLFDWPLWAICGLSVFSFAMNYESWTLTRLNAIVDFFTIAMLSVFIRRTLWSTDKIFEYFLIFVKVSVLFALIEGAIRGGRFPSMLSVGHVNQTAIYLAQIFGLLLAYLVVIKGSKKWFWTLLAILVAGLVIDTHSRNAIYTVSALTLIYIFYLIVTKTLSVRSLLVLLMLVASVFLLNLSSVLEVAQKQTAHMRSGSVDTERQKIWRAGILAFESKPFFGYGVNSFSEATSEKLTIERLSQRGEQYSKDLYAHQNHGHNLILTWLVERGVVATLLLVLWLAFLVVHSTQVLHSINRHFHGKACSDFLTNQRLKGLLGLFLPVCILVSGLGNTSFHHEHGLLAAMIIGFSFSAYATPQGRQD